MSRFVRSSFAAARAMPNASMPVMPEPIRLHRVAETPSTQDAVHRLAAAGAPAGTAILAATQTGGRGSRGRRWISPPGGLWLSVLVRPSTVIGAEVLSVRVGLGVAVVLESLLGMPPVQLKWPNDLMLGRGKLGGILCEARWQGGVLGWVTVGLGLNVHNPLPDEVALPAVRVGDYAPEAEPAALAERLVAAILAAARPEPALDVAELAAFAERDWLRGRPLAGPIAGQGAGLAADGSLLVRTAMGRCDRVRAGSVVLAER